MTARFGGGPKPHHDEQTQTNSRQDATDVGGTPPILASGETAGSLGVSEPAAVKKGPVFGTPLQEIPPLAMAISIIGGQRHQLPILVFSLVEAIFKRGQLLMTSSRAKLINADMQASKLLASSA